MPFVESSDIITMNSTVALLPNLILSIDASSLSYCPNDTINITSKVTNIGNLATNFFLNTTAYDQYNTIYINQNWTNQNIAPAETKTYFVLKNVSGNEIPGMYNVFSNVNYRTYDLQNQTTFRIKQSYGTLVSSPSFIEESVFPGDVVARDLYLWLLFACFGTTVRLNTTGQTANWIYFSQNPVYLSPDVWNATKIFIFIDLPWNTLPGDYTGNIVATINNQMVLYIPVTVHVQTTAIFDVQTEVLSQYKEVCKGEEVKAKVNILKIFPSGALDVNMTYMIQLGNNTYDQRKETIAVTDILEKFVTLKVPSNAEEGIYTFYSILDVANKDWKVNISSYDTFNVITCALPQPPPVPSIEGGGRTFPSIEPEIKKLEIKPTKYKILGIIGNLSYFEVKVKNIGFSNLTNIKLFIEGIPKEWVTISPYKIDKLSVREESEFLIFIKTPKNTKSGIYELLIKAKDSVESNQEKVLFILSEDEKNLTKTIYEQALIYKEDANKIVQLKCLDISQLEAELYETNKIFDMAKAYMDDGEYKKSQELFLKTIDDYEKIVEKVFVLMIVRQNKLREFGLLPFAKEVKQSKLNMEASIRDRDYETFCSSLERFSKNVSYSLVEAVFIVSFAIFAVYYAYHSYKKYREKKVEERLKEIKKRLEYKE
ncbi:MAG: hypothetical protein QXJ06_00165 [Candidatus Aenigmatarchaeota archaeon]